MRSRVLVYIDKDFPTQSSGILGRDFLQKYLCKIDYEIFILTLQLNGEEVEVPISTDYNCIRQIIIPPRSEIICPLKLNLKEDSVIINKEIRDRVLIASSIAPSERIFFVSFFFLIKNIYTCPYLSRLFFKFHPHSDQI